MNSPTPATLLIVDDTPDNIAVVAGILQPEGYRLAFATSGPAALESTHHQAYDLILLDVMMPGMDGFEVCRQLKADPRTGEIPVIFLTARTDAESVLAGFTAGGVDYLGKPFNRAELVARVSNHLQLQEARRALKGHNLRLQQEVELRQEAEKKLGEAHERLRLYFSQVHAQLHATIEALPDQMLVFDHRRRLEMFRSPDGAPPFGALEWLPGQRMEELMPPLAAQSMTAALEAAERHGRHLGALCVIPSAEQERSYELSVSTQPDPVSGKLRFIVLARDVTDRIEAERRLRQAAVVFEKSSEAILVTDHRQRILAVNPAFRNLTGYEDIEVLGRTPKLLQSGRHDEQFYGRLWDSLRSDGIWHGELWDRRKDGQGVPLATSITAVMDDGGEVLYYICILSDLSEKQQSKKQIDFLTNHDLLTELPNRVLLADRLDNALCRSRRSRSGLALLILGLDRFKQVNESFGHPTGDRLLREVARRLLATLGPERTVARIAGDEFAVVLEEESQAWSIASIAQQLIGSLRAPFELEGHAVYLTGAVGISVYPNDGDDQNTLLRNADIALSHAKQAGGNDYRFFRTAMTEHAMQRVLMAADLRNAIANGQLRLQYQPQLCLESRCILGAEALIRWQHPQLGLLPPNRFIPFAEECGLIVPLTEWVLNQAARKMGDWKRAGATLEHMAINLSALQFRREDPTRRIRTIVDKADVDPRHIELEITENVIVEDLDRVNGILTRLGESGFQIAIDDFGTGYSSLSYLSRLPIHKLKIDRAFVTGIPGERNNETIARTIIQLGRGLGMQVIAEGVENEAQHGFLQHHGCHQGQGFLYARPLAEDVFERLILPGKEGG